MIISKGEKRTKLKKLFLPKTQRTGSILEAAPPPKKKKQAGENKHKSEQNTRKIAMSAWPGKTSRIFRNTRGELGSG